MANTETQLPAPPQPDHPTPVSEWKKQGGHVVTVPSGKTALVRRVNLEIFLKTGQIPNSMRAILEEAMEGKKIDDEEVVKKFMAGDTEEKWKDMMRLVNLVVCDSTVDPKVYPVPKQDQVRNENILYVDEIDLDDRLFIFKFAVGGTADLEQFRKEQEKYVERVSSLSEDGGAPE